MNYSLILYNLFRVALAIEIAEEASRSIKALSGKDKAAFDRLYFIFERSLRKA